MGAPHDAPPDLRGDDSSDRLARIGKLTATVAHEIRNPCAYVLTNLGLMAEYLADVRSLVSALGLDSEDRNRITDQLTELDEMCADNRVGVQRIAHLAREVLSYSRESTEPVHPVSINEVVQNALSMVTSQVRERADVTLRLQDVPGVLGHAPKLAQVVMNLLVNAAHAVENNDGEGHVDVHTRVRNEAVEIVIRDNGCGMTDAVRARMFEPFFTTRSSEDGTGLGLALCADIVRVHNGHIECDSEPGRGTTFVVRLPGAVTVPPERRDPGASTPPSSRRARILIVDDDPRVLRSLERALAPPHHVVTARGAREALNTLDDSRAFDCIISDVRMPDTDGVELFHEAAARDERLASRFIFVTGAELTVEERALFASRAIPHLDKPLSLNGLRSAVEAQLQRTRVATSAA